MADIKENIKALKKQIPSATKLLVVSKTRPVKDILEAYNEGQRLFGENRVQELLKKKDLLPQDIEWHLIGHLQTNKVRYIVPFISMVESVDTFRLLRVINSEAAKIPRVVDCLLQIHIAEEEAKFGFSMDEITDMLGNEDFHNMKHTRICGVMGMATFTGDTGQLRMEFRRLAACFEELRMKYFIDSQFFKEKSMGMSGDFLIGISEGSTIVRIGSLIFGNR